MSRTRKVNLYTIGAVVLVGIYIAAVIWKVELVLVPLSVMVIGLIRWAVDAVVD